MSRPRAHIPKDRPGYDVLPDDLYIQIEPWPRLGRPPKRNPETWRVIDDWPERVPVTDAEIDIFEAWFGNLFGELFGPCQ